MESETTKNGTLVLSSPQEWVYITEGKNHIIFENTNLETSQYKDKILRVRKLVNKEFYSDENMMDEATYNALFIDNILQNQENSGSLWRYTRHTKNYIIAEDDLK